MSGIPGYDFGRVPASPIGLDALREMMATVGLGPDDLAALRRSHTILHDQTDAILDVWYGFVGSQPHLVAAFAGPDGKPLGDYLGAVRKRFGQWILDTAQAEYDERWLAWQDAIGRRHHRTGKNQTDGVVAASHVRFRDLFLLIGPVVATLRPFLAAKGDEPAAVDQMQAAWLKSVLLQVTLWSRAYIPTEDY